MIIETDFLDHWKTQMLIATLDDPISPCYLIRLWAHCQTRKEYRFAPSKLKPAILKAIMRAPTDAQKLWDALTEVGFLDLHEDGTIEVHGFYDANKQLIANWENGKKGGRPKKKTAPDKPIKNPNQTQPKPIEERERVEEKEEIDKGEKGDKSGKSSFSPSPRNKSFWLGKNYSDVKHRTIEDYSDIHAIQDPIEAAMAVTGDYSLGMYGSLVKGCNKALLAGRSGEEISDRLFLEEAIIFGEINAGEREKGKDAASGFTARMRDYFEELEIRNSSNAA